MSNRLKELTYLTIKELKKESIILPSQYLKIFESHAKNLRVNLEDEKMLFGNLQEDSEHLAKIVNKTNENLNTLHQSTTDAQTAINNSDSSALEHISNELKKMKEEIKFLQKELFSDPLTGTYNRKWFLDYYLKEEAFPNDGFIALIDVDRFNIINDSYGYLVGDQVLKYLANYLNEELGSLFVDVVRYSGDEFIVLFNKEKVTTLNIEQKIKDVQEKLSTQELKSTKVDSLKFTFSYGFLPFRKNQDLEATLETVDELMFKNKKRNK